MAVPSRLANRSRWIGLGCLLAAVWRCVVTFGHTDTDYGSGPRLHFGLLLAQTVLAVIAALAAFFFAAAITMKDRPLRNGSVVVFALALGGFVAIFTTPHLTAFDLSG